MSQYNQDVILWLDLETTGSQPDADVLEIGICLTDAQVTTEIATFERVVRPRDVRKFLGMDPVVQNMHVVNGLALDVMSAQAESIETVGHDLIRFLNNTVGADSRGRYDYPLIPLAGSGVSHFDRQFIRRDWPLFDKRLTYWAYDVGVLRRSLQLAGRDLEKLVTQFPPPTGLRAYSKNHRALQDAQAAAAEYATYLQVIA